MKTVVIGGSGHFEYAFQSANVHSIVAYAPGSQNENLNRLKDYDQLKRYTNYIEMLAIEKPDIAIVNPHYHLNSKVLIECLKRDINCFVEKPIALSIEELNLVKEVLKVSKATFSTMMIHRYEPWFAKAFELVKKGDIGQVVTVQAQKSYKMGEKANWMKEKAKFGGLIPWVGAHALDWLLALGLSELKVAFANQSNEFNQNNGEVESNATLVLKSKKVTATVVLDYLRPECANSHGDDRIRITGEKGIIEVMNQKVNVITGHQYEIGPFEKQPNIFDHFVESLNDEAQNRVSTSEAIALADLCISVEKIASI
ncbi:MAG: Gfo/Idh/MocA family oxidoreductase [Bacteroidia bacterium]